MVKALRGFDVIMLPVGGVYTVDAKAAAINPKIIVPMHYMTSAHKFALGELDKFIAEATARGWTVADNGADTLRLEDAPENAITQVVVLQQFED